MPTPTPVGKRGDSLSDIQEENDVTPANISGDLPLPPSVGSPIAANELFSSGAASSTTAGQRGKTRQSVTSASGKYGVIPATGQITSEAVDTILRQVSTAKDISPWNTQVISSSLAAMTSVPEAAYVLSHPDIIDQWQSSLWTGTLAAMSDSLPGTFNTGGELDPSNNMISKFFSEAGSVFSGEERKALHTLLAAMPNGNEILQEKNIARRGGNGFWGNFITGVAVVRGAPEAIRPLVNDPRSQLVAQMYQWLGANSLDTMADREEFFVWATTRAAKSIDEVASNASGFFAVAQQTVGFIPDVALNELNDFIQQAASPEQFATSQYLSLGQNFAAGLGIDPSEAHYNTASGWADAVAQIVLDPQNLFFGVGTAIKNAGRIPRTVSRGKALRIAANPFGGSTLGLPVLDRGIVNRFSYALLSRDVDSITSTPAAMRQWKWVSQTDSASRIAERFPSLDDGTDASSRLFSILAETKSVEEVREIVRAGMHGGQALGVDAPLLTSRKSAQLSNAQRHYMTARADYFANGGSLRELDVATDMIDPGDIYRLIPTGDEDIAQGISSALSVGGAGRTLETVSTAAGQVEIGLRSVNGANLYTATLDGKVIGGALGGSIAVTDEALRGKGIGTAIRNLMDPEDLKLLKESPAVSGGGARLLGVPSTDGVYQTARFVGAGKTKTVVSQLGASGFQRVRLEGKPLAEAVQWIDGQGAAGAQAAAELAAGAKLSSLTPEGRRLLTQWADAKSIDIVNVGEEMIASTSGQKLLISGADGAEPTGAMVEALRPQITDMQQAALEHGYLRTIDAGGTLVVKDLPQISSTRKLRQALSSGGSSSFMQGLRRQGFKMTHTLPSNISLTKTSEGARGLHNWIKAMGASDEVALKWADAFRAGSPATRKDIILEALRDAGKDIKNPLIREGLITFGEKQGHYTYFYDRAGRELGLGLDGSITPMTLAHFSDDFAMPEAREFLRMIKRYNGASNNSILHLNRGLLGGTRTKRADLIKNLKARLRHQGVSDMAGLTDEDWAAMAYADVLGSAQSYGRPGALGYVNKAATMAAKPIQGLHHVFVISQLALRPIAWASRVLMEETVRADLMSMPSLWTNPVDFISKVWDSSAIRKLPANQAAQAKVAEGLVNEIFASGKTNWNRLNSVMPDARKALEAANIDPNDAGRTRGFISHLIGREMMGDAVTEATIGLKGNITRRALLRQRKLKNTLATLDENGLLDSFRWDIDGESIANRSFYQNYVKEVSAGSVPIEYGLQGMTPQGLETYGRSYGRQVYQMISDPIVGNFGLSRAIAQASGTRNVHDGARLVKSSSWGSIKHIVDRRIAADGIQGLATDAQKADWYLTQIDEIVSTLFDPLAKGDLSEKVRIFSDLKNHGSTDVTLGEVTVKLNAGRNNYEGFVSGMGKVAEDAYNNQVMLPAKVSSWIDPRFGQEAVPNIFRRATDWSMMTFGEKSTQHLNRQPAYLATHGNYYKYYKSLGWDDEAARFAATAKAAELVNYVFFDNKNIPTFLRDMNKAVPFFSAMYEVGGTWLYKIPSVNVLPLGYAHLLRRTSRTLSGLVKSGLVSHDPESGEMTLNIDSQMLNANDPVTASFGKALFQYMRLPITMAEWVGGIGSMFDDEPGFTPANLSAFGKDGFSIKIGNPLDLSSHGVMAVNQFSVGLTPVLQLPLSMGATAFFAQSDEVVDVEPQSVAEWILANPEEDIGTLLRHNQEAFIAANGKEAFNRVLNSTLDLSELQMPDMIRMPETSTWETLVDRTFFPFGKTERLGEVLTSVSPAAMNYVWRGLFQKLGADDDSEIMAMLFGQMSNYQVASEVMTQLQMLEATEGVLTKATKISESIQVLLAQTDAEIGKDPDGAAMVLDASAPFATEIQELLDELEDLNFSNMKRANDNAAGALLMRGIMGQLGPSTPGMWVKEQAAAGDYWKSREIAIEAKATGSVNYSDLLQGSEINSFADMERLFVTTQEWMNDPSGDQAKVFIAQQNPAILPFTQGKSYWGPAGPPPETKGFDGWIEQLESGDRKPFAPEVFMARYQRAGVGIDKEISIINKYGNNPDTSMQAILADYGAYKELVEPFDMQYEALDFIDRFLYENKYAEYRDGNIDDLTAYELIRDRVNRTQEEVENINDLLEYADLDPDERRQISGVLNSTIAAHQDAIRQQSDLAQNDDFLNPREIVLSRYWEGVSNPYYTGRSAIFDQLDVADNKTQRSLVFDAVRMYNNEWLLAQHTVEGFGGEQVLVPAPQLRTWNGKSQAERQERLMKTASKKPEWLDLFEIGTLVHENPAANDFLPADLARQKVYDEVAQRKYEIVEYARTHPDEISGSQRDKLVKEVDNALDAFLLENGRDQEYAYRKALPIQKLDLIGILPESLAPIVPMVNTIVTELNSLGKSPTTEVGRRYYLRLVDYLETDFFVRNPQAAIDLDRLGLVMFDERLRAAVYGKLLQGDFFGELG